MPDRRPTSPCRRADDRAICAGASTPRGRRKTDRARTPAIAFFRGVRGGNPRSSGVSAKSAPARVPSRGEVSRNGAVGSRVLRVFSGHFRTSRSQVFGGRRAVGGRGGGREAYPHFSRLEDCDQSRTRVARIMLIFAVQHPIYCKNIARRPFLGTFFGVEFTA